MIRSIRFLWDHGDTHDRAQIVFYAVALPFAVANVIFDFPGWMIWALMIGVVVNVAWSFIELRRSHRRLQRALADYRRRAEIEYFEWLHDASPDD